VSVNIRNTWLLEGISLRCCAGEWTVIHGPTGAGKSTLLRAINGLCMPTRGCIWTLDTPIPGRSRRMARAVWRQTGTMLQEVALFETKTARENVELAIRTLGADRPAARAHALAWLERLTLADKADTYPCCLSGGERQRVALARAFAVHPRLLTLDEPTSALDRTTAHVVLEAVQELVEQGATVVMSSHRLEEVMERCDRLVALRNGRVVNVEERARRPRVARPDPGETPEVPVPSWRHLAGARAAE